MTQPTFPVSDLENFAKHLGLDGIDSDMFYECYYDMNDEFDDYECHWETSYDSVETY